MEPWALALIIAASVLLFLLVVFLIFGDLMFRKFLSHQAMDQMQQGHVEQKDNPYNEMVDWTFVNDYPHDEIEIASFDGTKLVGYLYKAEKSSHRYVVGVHGWGSSHFEQTKLHHRLLKQYDANILLVSQRGHELSGGKFCTMSLKERRDIKAWVEHILKDDPKAEIVLYGSSLGAASVLAAASLLGHQIQAVISDSSYLSAYQQFKESTKKAAKGFGPLLLAALYSAGRLFHHIDLKKADVIGVMKNLEVPVCLIHAAGDSFIDPACLDFLFAALPSDLEKEKHLFPHGDHCLAGQVDPEGYYAVVSSFIGKTAGW